MREIGLHLRLSTTLKDLFVYAQKINLPLFQCFLVSQNNFKSYVPTLAEIQACAQLAPTFSHLYLHGSYMVNLAAPEHITQSVFEREWKLANEIGFTHYILHPGSARTAQNRQHALELLAARLDTILGKQDLKNAPRATKLVLENAAHAGLALGGDLQDFSHLKRIMRHADKLAFCIDTAHAFSYGYDLSSAHGQDEFIQLLDTTIGLSSIALIHLNDTCQPCGSKIDEHALLGQGNIGTAMLARFVEHPALRNKPLILELPLTSISTELEILETVKQW